MPTESPETFRPERVILLSYVLAAPPEVGVSVGTFCGRDSVRDVCGTASDSY